MAATAGDAVNHPADHTLKAHLACGYSRLAPARRLATIRPVIEEGRIVERGRHEELLIAGGLYAELYKTQFKPHGLSHAA